MGLSPEQQEQLNTWLCVENLSYADAKERVYAEFGVTTSVGALQHYYASTAVPWKYTRSKGAADVIAALTEGNFDEATVRRAKALAFDLLSGPAPDVEAAATLLKIVGDSAKLALAEQKLGLDRRKVALLESKARQAEEAEGVTRNTALSPEERDRRMREIFGLAK